MTAFPLAGCHFVSNHSRDGLVDRLRARFKYNGIRFHEKCTCLSVPVPRKMLINALFTNLTRKNGNAGACAE